VRGTRAYLDDDVEALGREHTHAGVVVVVATHQALDCRLQALDKRLQRCMARVCARVEGRKVISGTTERAAVQVRPRTSRPWRSPPRPPAGTQLPWMGLRSQHRTGRVGLGSRHDPPPGGQRPHVAVAGPRPPPQLLPPTPLEASRPFFRRPKIRQRKNNSASHVVVTDDRQVVHRRSTATVSEVGGPHNSAYSHTVSRGSFWVHVDKERRR
jgi:hypothetical protein